MDADSSSNPNGANTARAGASIIGGGRRFPPAGLVTPFNMSDLLYNTREEVLVLDDESLPMQRQVAGPSSTPSDAMQYLPPPPPPIPLMQWQVAGSSSTPSAMQSLPLPLPPPPSPISVTRGGFASASKPVGSPKTELCHWFMRCLFGDDCRCGWHKFCPHGRKCHFAHGSGELRPKVCREFRATGNCLKRNCSYLHRAAI